MTITTELKSAILSNLDRLSSSGAEYVDVRYYGRGDSEFLIIMDGNLEANETEFERGIGVRVLYKGAWGFAATSALKELEQCFDQAFTNARTASTFVNAPLKMPKKPAIKGEFKSPIERNPIDVSLREKLEFLKGVDSQLNETWINQRMLMTMLQHREIYFFNSAGTHTEKQITNVFSKMAISAVDKDGISQRRSFDLYSPGTGTRGYEMLVKPELFADHAGRIKGELKELIVADPLEYRVRSVILLPAQGMLQVHETIGHPLELDRILGYELSYAGGSFVGLEDFGKLRYGSDKLSVSAFGGIENSPGTFGFDDEGDPERNYLLIDRGILKDALTSGVMIAEANEKAGRKVFSESGGCSRATAFYRAPIDRMSNVSILPGKDGTLEDIIANTEDGIVVDTPLSWSIGSNREHFHFGTEIAWEVKNGKKQRMLRNPTYQGHTLEFYNNLTAVGDERTWRVCQVENCGKGEPNQVMEIGHGVPVLKFDKVITGERS
jgi:TldD protein